MDNTDKVVIYIEECKSMGIKVLPPDVNESYDSFFVVKEGVRFGLSAIKNVGQGAIENIIEERRRNGIYRSYMDFCQRVDLRQVNKRVGEFN